jgi:hypothetical protein
VLQSSNSRLSPLPHEPAFSGVNDATVDIPLGGSKVSWTKFQEVEVYEDTCISELLLHRCFLSVSSISNKFACFVSVLSPLFFGWMLTSFSACEQELKKKEKELKAKEEELKRKEQVRMHALLPLLWGCSIELVVHRYSNEFVTFMMSSK